MEKKIIVDARVVERQVSHGIACYAYEITKNLIKNHCENKNEFYILICPGSCLLEFTLPKNMHFIVMKNSWASLLGQFELSKIIHKYKPSVFYSPSFIVPFISCVKIIATIHDMNHMALAQNYSFIQKIYYFFLSFRLKRKSTVITVSEFSKNEIIKYLNVSPSQIHVIYNGLSNTFQPKNNFQEHEILEIQKKYFLPKKYIFTVGNNKPHKNLENFLQAYCNGNFSLPLVVLSSYNQNLVQIAKKNNKSSSIFFLPFVEKQKELALIYAYSEVFIFPSLYEGFGFPPLEACASKVPVLTSNISSMPEILQNHALYFNPNSIKDMQLKLNELLNLDEDEKIKKVEAAHAFVKRYDWQESAEKTIELICL